MEVCVLVLLFGLIFQSVYCQSNSNSVLTSSTLRSAIVSKSGNVFVSDDNTVYLLNGDLSEVIQMDRNEGQSPEGMTLTGDEGGLVVCWANSVTSGGQAVNTAPCSIYNSSTLDVLVNVTLAGPNGVGAPRGNRYSVSRGFTGGSGETFFVMSGLFDSGATNRLYHREFSVSDGNVERQEVPDVEDGDFTGRTYHSGITVGNYTYIVADDVEASGGRVRVIRLCDSTNIWDSWYEIQLLCGTVSGTLSDFGSELLDANFLTVEDGASEAMLLATVKSESVSSATCSFPLSSIDSTVRGLLQYCQSNTVTLPFPWISGNTIGECRSDSIITECDLAVSLGSLGIGTVGPGRLSTQVDNNPPSQIQPLHVETPLNSFSSTVWSSSEVFLVDGVVVMFAGLSTGEVRKYTASNLTINEVDPSPERTWSLSSSVKSLTYFRGSDYVYAVTETSVYRLPVEECSNFTNCSSCTTSGGRLCGWCSVENKCSRSIQCANSNESLRWIQGSGQCLTVEISSAELISGDVKSYPREQETITVTITNLPKTLSGESFQCVFSGFGSGELTTVSGDMFSCSVPNIPPFVGEDTQTVNFTLRSTIHNIDFGLVVDGVTFYDCSVRDNCSSCVSSLNCNWCPVEFDCRTSGGDCSSSPVSTSGSCPRVLPSSTNDGRYYLHEGLSPPNVSLTLNAQNLISPPVGYSYQCEMSDIGRTFPAVVRNSSTLVCNIDSTVSIPQAQTESPLRLLWSNNNTMMNFPIESSSGTDQSVVLYSCPKLAVDCSSCIGLNDNFNCAYCTTASGSCMLSTLTCSPGSLVKAPNFGQCPIPIVDETSPTAGPVEGGTLYTIRGSNLGAYPRENVTILIDGKECPIDSSTDGSLTCVVPPVTSEKEVNVTLSRSGEVPHTAGNYSYAAPIVTMVMPLKSPIEGGSTISVIGVNLDIGNVERTSVAVEFSSRKRQASSTLPLSDVMVINSTHISCRTVDVSSSVSSGQSGTIIVNIDGNVYSNGNVQLEYIQPEFSGLFDNVDVGQVETLLQGGGVPLIINGTNLDASVSPMLTLTAAGVQLINVTCTVTSPTELLCMIPELTNVMSGANLDYSLTFDGQVLSSLSTVQPLRAVADPVFNSSSPTQYAENSNLLLTISGSNLNNVREADYNITVGGEPCSVFRITENTVDCTPPQMRPGGRTSVPVIVTVGRRVGVQVGTLEYTIDPIIIIVPVVAGAMIISGVMMILIICCVCCRYKSKEKERDRQFQGLITQMELMESELADECRRAFTELQTDLELAYDKSDQHLPYLEFRSFAMRVLFPQELDHPVLQPLVIPKGSDQENVMRLLDGFRQLIMDKKFLLTFIRTLEMQQGRFTVKDKCSVASLLMIAFQNDLDYANEILMALLHDLIQRSVAKYHPKLLLRRTDSVAEKMLTNWLCFLLYQHVVEHIGEPLYVLFRAIKSQLEKGPIDVLTGEARQSLSEEKLLRTAIDPKPIEGVIITEAGEIPIKMWDCDSVSQAKEKVLDAIYKNAPVSSRPAIGDVDLEFLQTSDKGLILRDHDTTNQIDGTWKKINTLGHYNLTEVSAAYKANPTRMPQPRFCLKPRTEGAVVSGKPVDTIGTIVANHNAANGGAKSDFLSTDSQPVCHLVKADESGGDREGRGKIISEVFLTRLLSTKRILQPYVDDLFNAIFTIPKGKPLPKAIKYLFDFLDLEAADLSQHDPDVLHTWKTNSLPLRFWVNIIKNPEFVFDIHKSASVDSCLTVVAQAYIDGCSTSDLQYTKDTPSARLLYVNEVKTYKKKVREYFEQIQALPKVSEYEMSSYLKEISQSNQQLYFVSESALFELFKYASTHSDALMEALNEEGLIDMAKSFEEVQAGLTAP